ncbi:MAG TPA: LLM class F420-dependent oxidoreductase [Chloroflexia bacterium]|nr:LLM class F420-dependent oxidoreductase [Chloroflexia bacterium]
MGPRFGVLVPQGWRLDLSTVEDPAEQAETMIRFGREAERLGFDSIWLYDHFHTVPTQELEPTLECWMSTAALARETTRIRIGQMVTCNLYRNPALLAKMASTVDALSGGRLDFGIGAGWYREEFEAYGYDFPDAPTRLRMLGEAVQMIRAMWTEPYATFSGDYYRVAGAINEPKGVQTPHIPIWLAGGGEKVTLKLVARYADACNIEGLDPEVYRHKFSVLRRHCDAVGRDYGSIIKSAHVFVHLIGAGEIAERATAARRRGISLEEYRIETFVGTPTELVDLFGRMQEAGVEYFVVYLRNDMTNVEALHMLAEEVMHALG